MIKRLLLFLLTFLAALALLFAMGPKMQFKTIDKNLPTLSLSLDELDAYIAQKEAQFDNIKPNNQSEITWYDGIKKTPYSVVYLHGFSASPMEGDPIHYEFAKRYGYNLYIPRLAEHGLKDEEALLHFTPKKFVDSAKEAIAIGKMIGDKVIVLSCSTGSTVSAYLAANDEDIVGQFMYSPNIDLHDPTSEALLYPWGLQLAQWITGSQYRTFTPPPGGENFWSTKYRLEAVVALKDLITQSMTDDVFKNINQPLFVAYYYKDEQHFDDVVSIPRMKTFFDKVSTPKDKKVIKAFPKAGNHVIASKYWNKNIEYLMQQTFDFAEEALDLQPIATIEKALVLPE